MLNYNPHCHCHNMRSVIKPCFVQMQHKNSTHRRYLLLPTLHKCHVVTKQFPLAKTKNTKMRLVMKFQYTLSRQQVKNQLVQKEKSHEPTTMESMTMSAKVAHNHLNCFRHMQREFSLGFSKQAYASKCTVFYLEWFSFNFSVVSCSRSTFTF